MILFVIYYRLSHSFPKLNCTVFRSFFHSDDCSRPLSATAVPRSHCPRSSPPSTFLVIYVYIFFSFCYRESSYSLAIILSFFLLDAFSVSSSNLMRTGTRWRHWTEVRRPKTARVFLFLPPNCMIPCKRKVTSLSFFLCFICLFGTTCV